MSIPKESSASALIMSYARYHVAVLKANPETRALAEAVEQKAGSLREKMRAREGAEQEVIERSALLDYADFALDGACRTAELEVLGQVQKDRGHSDYRAAFPIGLSALVAARGENQARQVATLVAALEARLPELAAKHGGVLGQLASAVVEAEKSLLRAEDAEGRAWNDERIARSELIRQLHANRGGLRVLYPREARRVSSFFPKSRGRATDADDEAADDAPAPAAP